VTTVYGPLVDEALTELTEKLASLSPELRAAFDKFHGGTHVEEDVFRALYEALRLDPTLEEKIRALAVEQQVEATLALQRVDLRAGDGLVVPPPSGVGLPRLDPLYEAHLQERAQYDGDMPELRFGGLPKGVAPAVPVDTDARDPVTVGWMLATASAEVAAEARQIEDTRIGEVQALLEGATEESAALIFRDPANLALLDRDNLPDPVGYERGKVPALRKVEAPDGWGLLALTSEQRQQLAWRTLSTTQGRRSMVKAIRDLVGGGLRNDRYDVEVAEGELRRVQPGDVLAYAEWSADLAGPNSTQAGFAFADVAWRSLLRKLEEALPDPQAVTLEVATIDAVDVRRVGFCARLLRRTVA
jgi:hypothetical protein